MKEARSKEELKNKLWDITELFLEAQENYKIVEYLAKASDSDEEAYVKRMNFIFPYIQIQLWQLVIIKLTLLFKRKEQYNIIGFLENLKKGIKNEEFGINLLTEEEITKWEFEIHQEQKVIDNILVQRNKLYAHKTAEGKKVNPTVTLEKAKHLIDLTFKILKEINIGVFERSLIRDPVGSPVVSLQYVVCLMTEHEIEKNKAIKKLADEYGIKEY